MVTLLVRHGLLSTSISEKYTKGSLLPNENNLVVRSHRWQVSLSYKTNKYQGEQLDKTYQEEDRKDIIPTQRMHHNPPRVEPKKQY